MGVKGNIGGLKTSYLNNDNIFNTTKAVKICALTLYTKFVMQQSTHILLIKRYKLKQVHLKQEEKKVWRNQKGFQQTPVHCLHTVEIHY